MSKPHAHVRLDFSGTCSIGPGKVSLLEGIERSGSLSAAARTLGMSYRRAWLLLHSMNEAFQHPVVELNVGGKDGGGAALTEFGLRLATDYRAFESAVEELAADTFAAVRPSGRPGKDSSSTRRPVVRTRTKRKTG